jgi:hypothetical protein
MNDSQVQTGESSAYTVTSSGTYTVRGENANCTGTTSAPLEVALDVCPVLTACNSLTLLQTTKQSDGYAYAGAAKKACANAGGRIPKASEMLCICTALGVGEGGRLANAEYLNAEYRSERDACWTVYVLNPNDCSNTYKGCENTKRYYRCVK